MANHFGLDFDLVELLARVDTDNRADHLGDNDHVTKVSLDEVGLLVGLGLLLGLAELLDETHGLALETAVEPSAGTGVDEVAELLRAEVEELLEVDSTVGELLEGALGLEGCGVLSALVLHLSISMLRVHLRGDRLPSSATCVLRYLMLKGNSIVASWVKGLRRGLGVRMGSVPAASSAFCVAVSRRIHYFVADYTHVFGISHGCGGREARKLTRWVRKCCRSRCWSWGNANFEWPLA